MSSSVCRICVDETNDLVSLLNIFYENTPAMGLIKDIFQINISGEEDSKTLIICTPCNNSLNSFYPFYKRVKQAQQKLQNQVNLNSSVKDPLTIDTSIIKQELEIEYDKQECNDSEQNVSNTSGMSDWMKKETDVECEQSEDEDSEYSPSESSQSCSQSNKSVASKKNAKRKASTSDSNLDAKKKKDPFEDTERIIEARENLLRKYKMEDMCQDGKWMLDEDDMDEVITLFVDLKCRRCPSKAAFKNYEDLNTHAMKIHKKPLKLSCCDREMERQYLERHILYFHILKRNPPKIRKYIDCPICKKSILKSSQKNHLSVHLPAEMRQFQCHLCNFGCGSIGPLNAHMKNIHPSTKVQCDECDKSFKTLNVLHLHKRSVHIVNSEHFCEECGKQFKTLPNLKTHILNVHSTDTKRIKCDDCGVVLKMKSYKRHKERHLLGKEEQCPHCPFKSKYLDQHIKRVHEKLKPFPCTECSMGFYTSKAMLDHMASRHTRIPRYKCQFCVKTFMTYGNYDVHRKRRHPRQLAELKLKKKMDKAKEVDKKTDAPKPPNKHNQVVQDVDSVLRNIEEIDNNKLKKLQTSAT